MSTTAGYFDETTLLNIRALASERLMDASTKRNFQARADVAQMLARVQTARIGELSGTNKKKDFTLEIEWPNNCGLEATDCEACATGGPELSSNTKTYKIEHCQSVPFSVDGTKLINNDFDTQTVIAEGILTADKLLSEYMSQFFINWLVTNAGIPGYTGGIGTVVGNEIQITAANFTIAAIGYMQKVLQYDGIDFENNIAGDQLNDIYRNVGFTEGFIPQGIGTIGRVNTFPIVFDLFNFTQTGWNDRVISIANGAVAFASRSYYGPAPVMVDSSKSVYTQESKFFPGMILEIWAEKTCKNDLSLYDFNVKTNFDFFLSPTGCEEDRNGILQFVEV